MARRRRDRTSTLGRPRVGGASARRRRLPAASEAESRIITLRDGARSLVTVVARLVSEDPTAGQEDARLIVRFELLDAGHRSVRVATLRARSLHAVDDERLRRSAHQALVSPAER